MSPNLDHLPGCSAEPLKPGGSQHPSPLNLFSKPPCLLAPWLCSEDADSHTAFSSGSCIFPQCPLTRDRWWGPLLARPLPFWLLLIRLLPPSPCAVVCWAPGPVLPLLLFGGFSHCLTVSITLAPLIQQFCLDSTSSHTCGPVMDSTPSSPPAPPAGWALSSLPKPCLSPSKASCLTPLFSASC